jgi:hypothetical protein
MNTHILSAAILGLSAAAASAQAPGVFDVPLAHTDVAPYTDIVLAVAPDQAPRLWKASLSREEVQAALRDARREGTVAAGEAINYPVVMKPAPPPVVVLDTPEATTMGAAPEIVPVVLHDGITLDGYRFVGGEAGYEFVGRSRTIQ